MDYIIWYLLVILQIALIFATINVYTSTNKILQNQTANNKLLTDMNEQISQLGMRIDQLQQQVKKLEEQI